MQSNYTDIAKMTAERTGKSEQMYKDLGSFIFRETSRMLKEPSSLIVKLKGIGSWHLRKKRMEIVVSEWPDRKEFKTRDQFETDTGYENYMEKHKQFLIFEERLKDYEKYLQIKKEIREKRNETQILLEPDNREDERFKSGED